MSLSLVSGTTETNPWDSEFENQIFLGLHFFPD